jgi:membrane associated rhomboid family serine protease
LVIPISDPDIGRRRWPVTNTLLIAASALVFFYELTLGATERTVFFYRFGLIPGELIGGREFSKLLTPWGTLSIASPFPSFVTLFSSMFIHGSWGHFLGNMVFLWVFGDNVEDQLGHLWYLLFYLGAGLVAAAAQVVMTPRLEVPVVGASGAIAGVLGAYIVLYPTSRVRTLVLAIFIFMVRIPAVLLLGGWFLLQFFGGLGSLGTTAYAEGGVAYWAHIGGFAAGLVVMAFLRLLGLGPRPRTRRRTQG